MSEPITSVTEGRVTITANDTEENIREAAGFKSPEPADESAVRERDGGSGDGDVIKTKVQSSQAETESPSPDRNSDGTFKAKSEPEPVKAEGDPRKSHQAKINLAIAKQREAERRADEAERRAAEREAELQAFKQPKPVEPEPVPTKSKYLADVQRYQTEADAPKYQEFLDAGLEDPYTAHQAAMAAYIADRRMEEQQQRFQKETREREQQGHIENALSLAAEAHPDFPELMRADTRVYPQVVLDHLKVESALDPHLSAELLHHLLTHPDDASKLATMTHPIAAAREIGRLIAGLSSAPSGPETQPVTTTAKPLIKPVRSSVMAHESSSPDDLPFGPKYIQAMNERDRKAREARRA